MNPSSRSSFSKERITSTQNRLSKNDAPLKTCLIPTKELEVLCESAVDINNLKANGFQCDARIFEQGWSKYLDRLVGPIYPELVKDFWVHATVTPTAIISFVLGHEVVITEKLIRTLYNLDDKEGSTGALPGRVDWKTVEREISNVSGIASHQSGLLKLFYKVWAEIIIGFLYHRKRSFTSTYINPDQKYALFCIGRGIEVNISNILFQNLKTNIEESRDEECKKFPEFKKNAIPFARMISDILLESDLLDSLRTIGTSKFFGVIQGHVMNAFDLQRMRLIEKVTSVLVIFPDILTRRVPVEGFTSLFKEEPNKAVKCYLEVSVKAQSSVDPAWIRGRVLPS